MCRLPSGRHPLYLWNRHCRSLCRFLCRHSLLEEKNHDQQPVVTRSIWGYMILEIFRSLPLNSPLACLLQHGSKTCLWKYINTPCIYRVLASFPPIQSLHASRIKCLKSSTHCAVWEAWTWMFPTHRIHVWYIYLHLPYRSVNAGRYTMTWILWDTLHICRNLLCSATMFMSLKLVMVMQAVSSRLPVLCSGQ